MDKEKKFLGARIEPQIIELVDRTAKENKIDRTSAIKILVVTGWKELQLKKALEGYEKGEISIDKAAKTAGITVSDMMKEVALYGIKSDETIDEYRQSIAILLKNLKK